MFTKSRHRIQSGARRISSLHSHLRKSFIICNHAGLLIAKKVRRAAASHKTIETDRTYRVTWTRYPMTEYNQLPKLVCINPLQPSGNYMSQLS
jgi:hypothetical protein